MKDNIWTMVILYTSMNLPLAIWMMRSFLLEVPREVLEAGEVDGAGLITVDPEDHPADRLARPGRHRADLLHLHLERVLPGG